jgi:hypothetical protein
VAELALLDQPPVVVELAAVSFCFCAPNPTAWRYAALNAAAPPLRLYNWGRPRSQMEIQTNVGLNIQSKER